MGKKVIEFEKAYEDVKSLSFDEIIKLYKDELVIGILCKSAEEDKKKIKELEERDRFNAIGKSILQK